MDLPVYPVLEQEKPKVKTSLDIIEKMLARSGLALTLSNDSRIIGVHVCPEKIDGTERQIDGIADILKTTLKFYKGWQWFVAGLIQAGLDLSEDFAQLLPSDHTLAKWVSVYNQYTTPERCFDLAFSYYEEVAYVKDRRARANLLKEAYEKGWSVGDLRAARNHEQGGKTPGINFTILTWQKEATAYQLAERGDIDWQQYNRLVDEYGDEYTFTIETRLVGAKS